MKLRDYVERFSEYEQHHVTPVTRRVRLSLIHCHLLPEYGAYDMNEVHPADIEDIYEQMRAAGLMPNTIFGCAAAMQSFFALGVQDGMVDENPVRIGRSMIYPAHFTKKQEKKEEDHEPLQHD